jgi:hypothetical protein
MKRIYLLMAAVLVTASIAITSCGKKNNDPIPSNPTPPTGGGGGGSTSPVACPSVMPGRTPGVLPNGVSNYMIPEGYWNPNGPTMEFLADTCWTNSYVKFTFSSNEEFGASFLNNGSWENKETFNAGLTKIKYHTKASVGVQVTMIAFPDDNAIKVEDVTIGTGEWVERTITVNTGWTENTELKFAEVLAIAVKQNSAGSTVEIANITME